jgi:ubiquinone/menaquinone biosynthesis C-methylase UbiE
LEPGLAVDKPDRVPVDPKPWLAEVFGRSAPTYDQVIPMCAEFAEDLLDIAGPRPEEAALDAACGRGAVTIPLARAVAPAKVIAVDLAEGMIRQLATDLHERGIDNVDLKVGNAEDLDVTAGSLDLITCGYGMQYLYDPARFCAAAVAALRPGGRLVASIPLAMTAAWNVYNELVSKYARRLVEPVQPGPPRPDLVVLFSRAGLIESRSSTVTRSFVLPTFEDWWTWTLSHGHRIFLDGLQPADRDEFRSDAFERMEPLRTAAGYELSWTTQIAVGFR